MALSKSGLSDLIYGNMNAAFKTPKKGRRELRKLADALADAIVTHIQDSAEVSVSTSTPFVTVPLGDPLPGTGTGSVG